MTHAQRNAVISKKIAAYTAKFTASPKLAREALEREGFSKPHKTEAKRATAT